MINVLPQPTPPHRYTPRGPAGVGADGVASPLPKSEENDHPDDDAGDAGSDDTAGCANASLTRLRSPNGDVLLEEKGIDGKFNALRGDESGDGDMCDVCTSGNDDVGVGVGNIIRCVWCGRSPTLKKWSAC